MENKEKPEDYDQVCVMEGVTISHNNDPVDQSDINEFEAQMKRSFKGIRVKFLEEIITSPGLGGEGGRNDLFFAVHKEDVGKFALPRLHAGIRWVEDVIDNNDRHGQMIHPERIRGYRTW